MKLWCAKVRYGSLSQKLGIDAVQIISNNGKAAQVGFPCSLHIAPRHPNDGQNLLWKFYPELVDEFHDMLKSLASEVYGCT